MREKIQIICSILITITILFLAGIYLNAYFECMDEMPVGSWRCINILNGGNN